MELEIKRKNGIEIEGYYNGNKVAYAQIKTKRKIAQILLFATSNGNKPEILRDIKKESNHLYFYLKQLYPTEIKGLGYNFLKHLILLIKERGTRTIKLKASKFAKQIKFYEKSLEKLKMNEL